MLKRTLMTRATYGKIVADKSVLKSKKQEMSQRIGHDYETGGGWHDNACWEETQRQQELLLSRIRQVGHEISNATFIDDLEIDTTCVGIGTKVTYESSGEEECITILGPADSDPKNDVVSFESDLAKAFWGQKVGEEVYFRGEVMLIKKIEKWI